jgi:hypothetical protein
LFEVATLYIPKPPIYIKKEKEKRYCRQPLKYYQFFKKLDDDEYRHIYKTYASILYEPTKKLKRILFWDSERNNISYMDVMRTIKTCESMQRTIRAALAVVVSKLSHKLVEYVEQLHLPTQS